MSLLKKSFIAYTLLLATSSCCAAQEAPAEPQTFGQAFPHVFNGEKKVWKLPISNLLTGTIITLTITDETDLPDIRRQIQEQTALAPKNQLLFWERISPLVITSCEVACIRDMRHLNSGPGIKSVLFLATKKRNRTCTFRDGQTVLANLEELDATLKERCKQMRPTLNASDEYAFWEAQRRLNKPFTAEIRRLKYSDDEQEDNHANEGKKEE